MMGGEQSMSDGCTCCLMAASEAGQDGVAQCLLSLLPPVDMCDDPGNAESNPDGAVAECRHECEVYWDEGNYEAADAAGCHNNHEDEVCVTTGVYAPGDELPWGQMCCEWCPDNDGDGIPDYEGCCDTRADGEMGCEDTDCRWMCDGLHCRAHEDQSVCEASGGSWTVRDSCAELIAMQPLMIMELEHEIGLNTSTASAVWLGQFGEVCCTGYEAPGAGSCDDDIETWVRGSHTLASLPA